MQLFDVLSLHESSPSHAPRDIPLLFTSFPSAKDPNWKSSSKSTCAIVTISSWEWFRKYEGAMVKKRGDEYEGIKKTLGHQMIEQACRLYPQIREGGDVSESEGAF